MHGETISGILPTVHSVRLGIFVFLTGVAACGGGDAKTASAPQQEQPPVYEPAPEELPGLEGVDISPVVHARYGAVSGCHVIESGNDRQAGWLALDWVIVPDGSVQNVEVSGSSFDNDAFHDCVIAIVKGLQFPEAPGSTDVSWRFKFGSGGAAQ